jgi:hypothetical protein
VNRCARIRFYLNEVVEHLLGGQLPSLTMKNALRQILVVATLFLTPAAFLSARADEIALPARTFAHPDRIRYDAQCFTIDGKDVFLYSGAFHYFRCPKELWRDRFQKIKDAGFNAVETYTAWNWHERQMPSGLNDFSKMDLKELDEWLTMAEQFGFYIIVRPGPYICAEWDGGGFPQWLMTKKPEKPLRDKAWLRSDDPVFLAWSKHWYDAVCPVIAKHQITRKKPGQPGVILVQLENEYDFAGFPADVMLNYVKALGEEARAKGIDVPLFTCWTHPVRGQADPLLRQVFDACNFYPRWDVDGTKENVDKLRREQPDAPVATTELQGGWFSQVGGKLSEDQDGVTASQINNLTLFMIQNGETLLNYYMLFGGTNPGDWAARDLTTSYDYAAPIREWGGVGDRYQRVWALGHMLREHGAKLARSQAVECDVNVPQKDVTVVMRRAPDGSRYLFVRTSQHSEPREGTAHVMPKTSGENSEIVFNYKLEPFGSVVLYLPPGVSDAAHGEWLPKAAPEISRPTELPASVTITEALSRDDNGPSRWKKMKSAQDLAHLGIYDSRFIFYRATVATPGATNLLVEFPANDKVIASINGKLTPRSSGTASASTFVLPPGTNDVRLLYENHGHPNIGVGMETSWGILGARLTRSSFVGGKAISGWRMHEVDSTSGRPEVKSDFNDDNWPSVSLDKLDADNLPENHKAVYRANLEMTSGDLASGKKILSFGRIDDLGWIFVNGKNVGKTTDWSRTQSFDVSKELHPGTNSIAVIVENTGGGGGLGAPSLGDESDSAIVPLESFGSAAGVDEEWSRKNLREKQWKSVSIPGSAGHSLLTWYRMKFELARAKSGVWVPWRLRLNARGNGFLYLNGHPLGRYWQAGPQHDFFLPECWLNFGKGRANVITLNLRPGDKGAEILSAAIEPYSEFAENRTAAK